VDAVALTESLLREGVGVEDVLGRLRAEGFAPLDAVGALRAVSGMSLGEADRVVIESETWADQRDAVLEWREQF
jgi:hypothetical protein